MKIEQSKNPKLLTNWFVKTSDSDGTLSVDTNTYATGSGTASGTNTGDQTSIVGITGTKSQFDTACTDGDFAYASDLASYVTLTGAQTVTNKRITKRAPTVTQSATPTINTDITDVAHITGLAQAITSMTTNLTGAPVEGDMLRIDITDNWTARAITWGASFEASGTVALPTTTVVSTRLDVVFVWNTVSLKWRCCGVA